MAAEQNEDLKKCGSCKKAVKKQKRYYRNGKYYCNMNCWNTVKEAARAKADDGADASEKAA